MATIVISSSNTTKNNDNINMKSFHEIFSGYFKGPNLQEIFQWHDFNGYNCNQFVEYYKKQQ